MEELCRTRNDGQIVTGTETSINRVAKDIIDYWKIWKTRSNADLRPWTRRAALLSPEDTAVGYREFEKAYNAQIYSFAVNFRAIVDRSEKALRDDIGEIKAVMCKRWNELGKQSEKELKDQGYL